LPRFNMPLELGIFLGAKRYGGPAHRQKACLILHRDPYRYQILCSDISGQDIRAHGNQVARAILAVREFLRAARATSVGMPGARRMAERYAEFLLDLPRMCRLMKLDASDLGFLDYRTVITGWLEANEW